jgi:hypothetical protein
MKMKASGGGCKWVFLCVRDVRVFTVVVDSLLLKVKKIKPN